VARAPNHPSRRGPSTREDSEPDQPTPISELGDETPPLRARGDAIGRYVVVDVVGQGGMGVVYSAWDPQLDRRIALKLVTLGSQTGVGVGTDGEIHRLRLLREAQALARLEHPNVVKVHDVGVCRTGPHGAIGPEQVFIAMEYVPGRSLRDWLRAKRRSSKAVLDVFIAAGRGLAAAHRAGLVHRDFKPDNVLVGEAGEVKVVDFGLARDSRTDDRPRAREWNDTEPSDAARASAESEPDAPVEIEPESSAPHSLDSPPSAMRSRFTSSTGNLTLTGTVLGTPAYMAPEQHARATVDARSDQYAFCVALWEAVYGKRPFPGRRGDVLADRKRKLQIRESSRGQRVPRWLRSAMLRGLSVDPARRFADMDELLAELERHLVVRRRRLLPAALLGGASVLGLTVSVWASSNTRAGDAAPCAAPTERLVGVWDDDRRTEVERALLASDLAYADDTWRRVAAGLDDYREHWLAAEVEACEATHLRHEHDAEWLEQRLACLDDRWRALASLTTQLARSDARTVESAARAVGSLPPIDACEGERAPDDLTPLPSDAHLRLRVERQLEHLADARAQLGSGHLQEGLAAAREVLASEPSTEWPALAAEAQFVIGNAVKDLEGDQAIERRHLHAAASEALRSGHRRLAVLSWARLVRGLVQTRDFSEAEQWLNYAERLAAVLTREHGEDLPLAADLEHARAQLRFHQQDYAGAEQHARRRLELLREFYGPDNPRVADALNNLGVAVYMQHRKDEAVSFYREALAILVRVQGPDHPSVASMHNNIGVVLTDRQLYSQALPHYTRALEIRRRVFPRAHDLFIQSLINLANVHLFSNDYGPGIDPALEVVLAIDERLGDELVRSAAAGIEASELAVIEVQLVPHLITLGRLFAGTDQHHNALAAFGRALVLLDAAPDARFPPGFQPPAVGEPWPAHLEGCRADVLLGIETSARALGRDPHADWALAERTLIPVPQPSFPQRCLYELDHWAQTRAE
jgi:serine/threonine protein kinase/tetratricopeptide (TPR) repeat protein